MVKWIIDNSEWLFSGFGGAAILAIIGWLRGRRKSDAKETSTYSVQQTNSGGGDNVGRDKIVKE